MKHAFHFLFGYSLFILPLLDVACNSVEPVILPSSITPSLSSAPFIMQTVNPTSVPSTSVMTPPTTPVPAPETQTGLTQTWTASAPPTEVSGFTTVITGPAEFIFNTFIRTCLIIPDYIVNLTAYATSSTWTPLPYSKDNDDVVIPTRSIMMSRSYGYNLYTPDNLFSTFKGTVPKEASYTLVLIHGNNQESKQNTLFRWYRLIEYFKQYPEEYKRIGSPFILLFQYDSHVSIGENGIELKNELEKHALKTPILLLGHSRGGLVARAARSVQYDPTRWMGIVQLSSPNHGSPLLIPELMMPAFSSQPLKEIKKIIYFKTIVEWNALSSSSPSESISKLIKDMGHSLLSDGTRSLFFDGVTVPIPTGTYTILKFPPITGTVDPHVRQGMHCFPNIPPARNFMHLVENNNPPECTYNYMDALHLWEYGTGIIADTISHAGYLSKEWEKEDEAREFANASASSIVQFFDQQVDEEFERKGLNWLSTQFMFIPTAPMSPAETDYRINDGMVDIASQCDLAAGETVFSSNNGTLIVNQNSINSRIRNTLGCIIHKDMNHADMVETQDPTYWHSITDSLFTIVQRYHERYNGIASGLYEDDIKAIYKLFNIEPVESKETVIIIKYYGGWKITITSLGSQKNITREDYYIKKEGSKWCTANEQELTKNK